MKRSKPLQGLELVKDQIKTVLDIRYASDGRGLNKKLMVNYNGWYMPTYSLYIVVMLIYSRSITMMEKNLQKSIKL